MADEEVILKAQLERADRILYQVVVDTASGVAEALEQLFLALEEVVDRAAHGRLAHRRLLAPEQCGG